MSVHEEEQNSRSSVEILSSVTEIVRQITPDLLRVLGDNAILSAAGEDWLDDLSDVAHKLQAQLHEINSAVNDAAIRNPFEEDIEPETIEEADIDIDSEPEIIVLSDLERAIMNYALQSGFFRMEVMRKEVPEVAALEGQEYKDLKSNFDVVRQRLVDFYKQNGREGEWEIDGQARGKKYHLITENSPSIQTDEEAQKTAVQTPSEPEASTEPEPPMVEVVEPEPIIEETTEVEPEPETESTHADIFADIAELGMTPNEQKAIRAVVDYLSGFEGRQGLSTITREVFGRSQLPRSEKARLIEILDIYSEKGVLRGYGQAYGFRDKLDREQQPSPIFSAEDVDMLSEDDQELLTFLVQFSNVSEVNIGEIVRGFFKVQTLERSEFNRFLTRINGLADHGFLRHAPGSAWYSLTEQTLQLSGSNNESTTAVTRKPAATTSIVTPVTYVLPEAPTATETQELPLANQEDLVVAARRAASSENVLAQYSLSEREIAMTEQLLAIAKRDTWFQRGDIDFSDLEFVSGGALQQAFSKLTQRLIAQDLLIAEGEKAQRRYMVTQKMLLLDLIDKVQDTPAQLKTEAAAPTKQRRRKHTPEPTQPKPKTQHTEDETPPVVLSERERQKLEHRNLVFAGRFVLYLGNRLEIAADKKERLTVLVEETAETLNISKAAARTAIGNVVQGGHYFYDSEKGTRLVSVAEPAKKNGRKRGGNGNGEDKDDVKAWTRQDVEMSAKIMDQLLTKTHVQQGVVIRDIVKGVGVNKDEEAEFRRTLRRLEATGIVYIDKNTNPNTRSDHSKKLYLPGVKFTSQQNKERWKNNRKEVIAELEARIV